VQGYTIPQDVADEIARQGEAVCPHCLGDGSVDAETYWGFEPMPCPLCNARGFLDAGDLAIKWRVEWTREWGWHVLTSDDDDGLVARFELEGEAREAAAAVNRKRLVAVRKGLPHE